MESTPKKGDRLLAKVNLTAYKDNLCKVAIPPVFPGPAGLRKSTQYPQLRKTGEEVGTYTGNASEVGYEVNFLFRYFVAKQKIFKWENVEVFTMKLVWVRKEEVTGYWDVTGVDSPVNDPANEINDPPPPVTDNTNLYLLLAVGFALLLKFVLPSVQK